MCFSRCSCLGCGSVEEELDEEVDEANVGCEW